MSRRLWLAGLLAAWYAVSNYPSSLQGEPPDASPIFGADTNDLIQRIINAMIRQEGEAEDAVNPLNLRGAPWLTGPVIENGFWVPVSRAMGLAGGAHLLALHVAQGNSLQDFIAGHPGVYSGFAPAADHNDPVIYVAHIQEWASIPDANAPLWTYLA